MWSAAQQGLLSLLRARAPAENSSGTDGQPPPLGTEDSQDNDMVPASSSYSVPWQVILANIWTSLDKDDCCNISETCKDAFYQIRHNLQDRLAVYVSGAYAKQLVGSRTTLSKRYPHLSDLCLCVDDDHLEDLDDVSRTVHLARPSFGGLVRVCAHAWRTRKSLVRVPGGR